MPPKLACIAGEEIHRQWDAGRIAGRKIGRKETPFGPSNEFFLVEADPCPFYLLGRYGMGLAKTAPGRVNSRANLYAMKDLGVEAVLAWGPAGAITHNIAVGDLVVAADLLDLTHLRAKTFFEDSPLGYLRQFPVFCDGLRHRLAEILGNMKLVFHPSATIAVTEGPRLETPAEVRMLTTIGAELVTHAFVPEMFLARELQMCYAAICYVVNYAETGSRHRPFATGELFAGLTTKSDNERLAGVVAAMTQIAQQLAAEPVQHPCECRQSMDRLVREYDLPGDWRKWFTAR